MMAGTETEKQIPQQQQQQQQHQLQQQQQQQQQHQVQDGVEVPNNVSNEKEGRIRSSSNSVDTSRKASARGKSGKRKGSTSRVPSKPGSAQNAETTPPNPSMLASQPPEIQQETIDPQTARLHLMIASAFKVFDNDDANTVDVNEIGTIVRSLGCCPSEADLQEIIMECEEEESTGNIRYERFESVMTRLLQQGRFRSASIDDLVEAFKVFDEEAKGYLDPDEFAKHISEKGEMFTEDEITEMFRTAVDVTDNRLYYEDHAMILVVDKDVYPHQD